MKKADFCQFVAVVAMAFVLGVGSARAQSYSQEQVCRGWNNPTNFTDAGAGLYNGTYYEGRVGSKPTQAPNALSGQTGVNWSSTVINRNQMGTYQNPDAGGNTATFPSNKHLDYAFEIYSKTDQVSGSPVNRDPQTGNQLPFVPWEQYNTNDPTQPVQTDLIRSIRIGTGRGRGSSGGINCAALYYYINVRPENAMLYLYYSCVIQDGNHGTSGDPSFMIRVMKQNDAGDWVQASPTRSNPPATGSNQCDTLAYFITATSSSSGGDVNLTNNSGWHGSFGYNNVLWKEWDKVVINLTPMLYSRVRIEVMVAGCNATVHYAYAYVCGECRPMEITTSGCPAGRSTDVTTLAAPSGMRNYVWYRSENGSYSPMGNTSTFSLPVNNPNSTAYYTWHQLTPNAGATDTSYRYRAQAADFTVEYMPNDSHTPYVPVQTQDGRDSLTNKQAFRCEVESAINPAKPYKSNIYAIVQNIKPTNELEKQSFCGGDVELKNQSYVPGDNSESILKIDSTIWSFYNNPDCMGTAGLLRVDTGANVTVNLPGGDMRYVKVRTNIDENSPDIAASDRPAHNACYSEAVYEIQPLPNPNAGFAVSDSVLCASDPVTTLTDTTVASTYRKWIFRAAANDSTLDVTDTVVGVGDQNRSFQRVFPIHTGGVEPIELIARNGLFYLNPVNQSDTIWCQDTAYGRVNIFTNPELERHGDSIVCQGDKTKVWVTSDISNCTYQWSTSYGSIQGGLPVGDTLKVVPVLDTATYYVCVTSPAPQNCKAWDSARVFLVKPKLAIIPNDGQICPGQPVTLIGSNAHHYGWSATPTDTSLNVLDSTASIVVTPQESTRYTLVGYGSNNCAATPLTTDVTVHPYPVSTIDLTPGVVDSEDPVVTLRDVSPYSVSSVWTFAGAEIVPGREVTHVFEEATGADSVYFTLTNYNDLGCETVKAYSVPVNLYTIWFPNVFTPGSEDGNARFKLYSINVYEIFHIYIYNRFGQLVFESSDPAFEWDGNSVNGTACPQGSYTFICRYRKPGAYTVASVFGSITLVR